MVVRWEVDIFRSTLLSGFCRRTATQLSTAGWWLSADFCCTTPAQFVIYCLFYFLSVFQRYDMSFNCLTCDIFHCLLQTFHCMFPRKPFHQAVLVTQPIVVSHLNCENVIGPSRIMWCAKINNNVAQFCQCSVMFLANVKSRRPCSRGTWCTMWHHASIFWSDHSIRQINTYSMLLHHGWRHIFVAFILWYKKQILTVSLDQHWKIMPLSRAMGNIFQWCPRQHSISV